MTSGNILTQESAEKAIEILKNLEPYVVGELTVKRRGPPLAREEWIRAVDIDPNILSVFYTVYRLYRPETPTQLLETTYRYLERLGEWLEKPRKLYPEDSRKRHVLLVNPSNRQFKNVWGRWGSLAWREKTLYGDKTPTEDGWMEDLMKIAEALKGEGVEPIIAVDQPLLERWREIYGDVVELDIPETLPKIGYTRDQSLTFFHNPIIGYMAIDVRRGEEDILINVFRRIGLDPIYAVAPEAVDGYPQIPYVEGGNFIAVETDDETVIFTGIGIRGTNHPGFKSLARVLPRDIRLIGIPIASYIREWIYGAVHLDVVMMYVSPGARHVYIDPSRMGLYSFLEYDRNRDRFTIRNGLEVFKELDIYVDEPPRKGSSPITMVNALNLGDGKVLVDSYNREVNRFLEGEGVDVIEVDIPHIEAGGGGVRCATKELWLEDE